VNLETSTATTAVVLRVITIHISFITGYDTEDGVEVVSGLLFEFPADRNTMGLLDVVQQSLHKSRTNTSHVQIVRQNALNGPV
jgi:preprotein translocase subunit SecF